MSEFPQAGKLRVLLARPLFSDPEVLLLDERPTNLDIKHYLAGWKTFLTQRPA